jgi:hypothetical protein
MDADPDWPPQKTVWRGVLHQHAAGAALAGGIMLIIGAPGGRAKAGCAVYAGTCRSQHIALCCRLCCAVRTVPNLQQRSMAPHSDMKAHRVPVHALAGALTLQLFCSALYHVPSWRHGTRTWLRRLDHACIFTCA